MTPWQTFFLSLLAAAVWQLLQSLPRFCRLILPTVAMSLGNLLILIGDWLLKKGGLNVKPEILGVPLN